MSTTNNPKQTTVNAYVFFDGRCEEAIEFYRQALGAELGMMVRFKDRPEMAQPGMCPPGSDNKIMHANLKIGDTHVLVSDGRCGGNPKFEGFALTISVPDEATADRLFNGLVAGGQVVMPLAKTFYSPRFGMVTDRFGVMWMVMVPGPM
jgi:PhnB protein